MRYLLLTLRLPLANLNSSAEYHRSYKAKAVFKHNNPCPSTGRNRGTCPNYIIAHINPLACGGADDPSNMQWQSKSEAKAKNKWERKGC